MKKRILTHLHKNRFELEFLDYLARQGIPVARPLANQQGGWLTRLQSPTAPEYIVLFEFADGRMFDGAGLKDADIRRVGVLAAKLHQASDRFRSTYHRYHLNPEYLLEKPLRTLQAQLARRNLGDLAFFAPVAEELRRKMAELPRIAPAYGLIHGDLIGSNLHLDEQGQFTLIDFDHCGYGWRAYELVPWGFTTLEVLVVEGYESVRPLSALEKTLLPDFIKLREIWGIGDILNMYSVWGRTAEDEELNEYVALLRGLM